MDDVFRAQRLAFGGHGELLSRWRVAVRIGRENRAFEFSGVRLKQEIERGASRNARVVEGNERERVSR